MPEILPRFYRHLLEGDEVEVEVEVEPGMTLRRSADGHNRDRRRGLPVITRGIGGTSPGTTRWPHCSARSPRRAAALRTRGPGSAPGPLSSLVKHRRAMCEPCPVSYAADHYKPEEEPSNPNFSNARGH